MCQHDDYEPQHLNVFENCLNINEEWVGGRPKQWAEQVMDGTWDHLPDQPISRQQLIELCSNPEYSEIDCILSTMAWGGLRRDHGRILVNNLDLITATVESLRNGEINASTAYNDFFNVTDQTRIGIGPAFYTKIIFFNDPLHSHFIMDQWTAKSINLLTGIATIQIDGNSVSRTNGLEAYDYFCTQVRCLARLFERTPEHIEMSLFSQGGRNPEIWRHHVMNNWSP